MSRIFMSLSLLPLMLVAATMGLGWWIGDYNGAYTKVRTSGAEAAATDLVNFDEHKQRFNRHFQSGVATALAVVLINSLSVTYLIGTSRWVKEVVDAYGLNADFIRKSTKIKRVTFPWSISGVFAILGIVALGAASDPATMSRTTAQWVTPHLIAAIFGACVIVYSIVNQAMNLQRNSLIIDEVVAEVKRERVARGLPTEAA